MKITSKGETAIQVLIEMSKMSNAVPHRVQDLAAKTGLCADFLQQIFLKLNKAGIVKTIRGPGGGVKLVNPASVTLLNVLEAVGEKPFTSSKRQYSYANKCLEGMERATREYLSNTNLVSLSE